jgi:hypothetical protein
LLGLLLKLSVGLDGLPAPVRGSDPLAMSVRVFDTHQHRLGDIARTRRAAAAAYVGDDHGAVTSPKLSAVVLADPHPLDEPERRRQPSHRLAHVG